MLDGAFVPFFSETVTPHPRKR